MPSDSALRVETSENEYECRVLINRKRLVVASVPREHDSRIRRHCHIEVRESKARFSARGARFDSNPEGVSSFETPRVKAAAQNSGARIASWTCLCVDCC